MVLRWKIGKYQYVEAYEHRVKLNLPEASVHHRNEVKDDNSAENLIPLSPSEHGRLHNPKQLDIQLVRQLYEAGETMPALAARFQVNSGTISRAIAEAGGQGRSLSLAVDLEAVRQLRAQGFGALRIGRLLNVSTSRINKAFRQAGL